MEGGGIQEAAPDNIAVVSALRTFGELMGALNIVPSIRQMVQGTSQPGHSHIR
jgi:hypothetical protein